MGNRLDNLEVFKPNLNVSDGRRSSFNLAPRTFRECTKPFETKYKSGFRKGEEAFDMKFIRDKTTVEEAL